MKNQTLSFPRTNYFYQALYMVVALGISYLFGRVMAQYILHIGANAAGIYMLPVVGAGWVLQLFLIKWREPSKFASYFYALTRIMFTGVLVLIPILIAHSLIAFIPCPWHALSVATSFTVMFFMHRRTLRGLHISSWYQASWVLFLVGNAALWIYYFNLTFQIL